MLFNRHLFQHTNVSNQNQQIENGDVHAQSSDAAVIYSSVTPPVTVEPPVRPPLPEVMVSYLFGVFKWTLKIRVSFCKKKKFIGKVFANQIGYYLGIYYEIILT